MLNLFDILESYKKNNRSLPFWSWNDKLDKDKLVSQIEHMHIEKKFAGKNRADKK